jgi:lysophosphatidic acid acyltransferase / lysophosphatidylinositol acyltransferase
VFAFKIDFWSNSKIILYTKSDAIEKIQTSYSLVIPNHSTEIDHFVLPSYGEKLDILGLSNAFVKKSLLYFPIIGQCFLFCCRFIFLDRSFDKDEKNIKRELVKYIELKYPGGSTLFFAEGTRFTEEKNKASIEFAKSKNLPIYKYHLLPRTKGFKACVEVMKKMKDKKCIIMHVQTYCKGPEPTVLNLFRGKSMEFHIFVEAIPIEEVEATDKWLFDLYQRKDDLHDSFEKFGNFYEGRKEVPIEGVELKPSLRVFVNGIFWCIVTFLSFFKFSIWMHQNGYTMTLLIILFTSKFDKFIKFH